MGIKYSCLILIVFLSFFKAKSQQLPVQNNHFDLLNLYNPAAPNNIYGIIGGIYYANPTYFKFYGRSQWLFSGLNNGNPFTGGFDLEGNLLKKNKAWRGGVGMITDQAGAINVSQLNTRASLEFFPDNAAIDLSIGVGLKLGLTNINFSNIDNSENDPLRFENNFQNRSFMSVPIGVFSKIAVNENTDVLSGVSILRLINIQSDSSIQFTQHYYGNLGVLIQFEDKNPDKPQTYLEISSFFTYVNNVPVVYSGHVTLHLKRNINNTNISSFGFGYAKNSLQFEYQLFFQQKYGIGLTADFLTLGKIQQYGGRYANGIELRVFTVW